MQPTNQAKPLQRSRCMYCGSTTRGKGCRYAPHGVHFHPDDPTKCAYCGSSNYGKGCHVNPISDIHVHGVNYNSMFKEQVQSFLDSNILLKELKKDFRAFEAFKLGLIDERGNKIKAPSTLEEHAAYSPMIKTVLKLKRYLGAKVDLLEASVLLEREVQDVKDLDRYKKLLEYKDELETTVNNIYKVLDNAHENGFEVEEILNLIKA